MSIPTSIHAARELIRVKASGNEFVLLVHGATNWEPWGPTGTQMDEVSRAFSRGSVDIMEEIKLRLKNRDKSWRPCYKSLLLLDHLARNVPESGLPAVCSVIPTLRTISQSFYYTGSKGTDHGLSVRERAKKLCDLLSDSALLREEREKAALTRFKLSGASGSGGSDHTASRYQGYSRSTLPSSDSLPHEYELHTHATRTKEEQERYDMELAARLQREEEMRAGMSAADVERMFHRHLPRQPASVAQAARNSDLEVARRLQEEEEQKRQARRTSETLPPAQGTSTGTPAKPPSPKTVAPAPKPEPEPPKKDLLDDLFAPAPVMTTTTSAQQPTWTNGAPIQQQTLASVDPFDAFLDTRIQQQQQQQQMTYGAFSPSTVPPQQHTGMMEGGGTGGWSGVTQPSMMMPAYERGADWSTAPSTQPSYGGMPAQASWGVPSSAGNAHASAGMQGTPFAANGNANMQGWAPFTSASPGGNNTSLMEEQMAHFAGQASARPQQPAKSLDALMAERRGMD
ncbi:epsin [Trypanosoma rangeli]|uniref:Epsin n=1 Tax=Trypanosoma rangeli TaxID=5698 RepID=A0A422NX91_TRYRA|nr:epsin [Trypanosoma rangeli]RNF10051.1 epsin [Trypanosoma rangeli]|eukprot:RNF10051.1 epsin [Trypanosoma rangeli]